MADELNPLEGDKKKVEVNVHNTSPDTVYGLGLIGAWVYFIGRAQTTDEKVKGFFKGFAWPAILVYKAFQFLDRE